MARLSTFKRGFASTFGLELVSRGLSALTLLLLLRSLSVSSFAFIILLLNVGNFLGSAATGGIRLRYARLEAERISRGHETPSAFHWTLISGTGVVMIIGLIGLGGAALVGVGPDGGERLVFALVALLYTLSTAALEMTVYHYQAHLEFTKAGLVQILRSAIMFVVALIAALGVLSDGTAVGVGFDFGLVIVALALAVPVALSTRGSTLGREGRFGFGRETASLTLYSLASAGWAYLDIFLVAFLLDDFAVASYGAALRYAAIIMGPVPALIAVLRVRTSQSDLVDSEPAQRELMANWAKRTALPAAAILGTAALAAIWVIPFIDGGRYPLSVPIFQILMVAGFAQFVALPSAGVLVTQKRYSTLGWINAAMVLLNVPAAIAVAPALGPVGVAGAGTLITLLQIGAVVYMASRPPHREQTHPQDEQSLAGLGPERSPQAPTGVDA
jgi:O-antigen/teichoic acid export membrane protein